MTTSFNSDHGDDKSKQVPLTQEGIRRRCEAEAERERAEFAPRQNKYPPLTIEQTRVKGRITEEPAPLKSVLNYYDKPLIVREIVGGVVAAGGSGKTFFMLHLAYEMAKGGNLGPLQVPEPLKVLVLIGEDPQTELDRRLWAIGKGYYPENLYAVSIAGKVGPLMRLEGNEPKRSEWFEWLEDTIKNHQGLDVLILDPKSRFYGLDENNNDHATQWIASLEALAVEYNLTILFTHHVNKASTNNHSLEQGMSRGASALVDGCRFVIGLRGMSDETANRYGVENPRQYIEIDTPKSNYAPKLPNSLYFKRKDDGVLEFADLGNDRLKVQAEHLVSLLTDTDTEYSRRDLRKEKKAKNIADQMALAFKSFLRRKHMDQIVNYAIQNGWLIEEQTGDGIYAKSVIKVASIADTDYCGHLRT